MVFGRRGDDRICGAMVLTNLPVEDRSSYYWPKHFAVLMRPLVTQQKWTSGDGNAVTGRDESEAA